ncbi:YajG family lipoprotein [Sulfurimonas sp.]|uniref:YajG family lipoprotein n=1 Tax=Sulfurimonas sp. TaxID=2022749 RepID=UPI002601080F|nr:YajG family lipoprotein [Sulfurimonas sp.]
MKSMFYLLAVVVFLGGCSYKNEAINLSSYNAQYLGESSKEKKSVLIESVVDARVDKKTIGYILKDGKKTTKLFSNENFEKKYMDGLRSALHMAGFKSALDAEADLVVSVNIKSIEIIHDGKSFDKNLKGMIELEVIIKKGKETITQNFKPSASKWMKPSYSSTDLEPFLNELFSDSINDVVSRLTRH